MSDRQIAKNRFHRALSGALRRYLRRFGLSLDEEAAQFALGGVRVFQGVPEEALTEAVNTVLGNRENLMRQWQAENPKANPYPPSFPERVLRLVSEALEQCYASEGTPEVPLTKIQAMCKKELDTEPVTIATDDEEM